MKKTLYALLLLLPALSARGGQASYVDYVSPLVGTMSKFELSTGNTYPAIARPWGMNFWTPQTGKMGDGWAYVYSHLEIRGFKQTHQPSPWINDYGQFSLMPTVGTPVFDENERASWFSHKAETALPHYYRVYLAKPDVTVELTPTERAAIFRFTFPESDSANVVVDAFDRGSYVRVIPGENKIVGYSTRNSGGCPFPELVRHGLRPSVLLYGDRTRRGDTDRSIGAGGRSCRSDSRLQHGPRRSGPCKGGILIHQP